MPSFDGKFPYVVVLKNRASLPFSLLGIFLNVISCLFFFWYFVLPSNGITKSIDIWLVLGLSVVIAILVRNIYYSSKGRKVFYNYAYLLTAILWLAMPMLQWLFIAFVILALLERQVKFPLEIGFSENQIVLNTFFKKRYQWSQLTNVMLKDGLLTMDFANNRLLQREVEDEPDEDDATEEEFNQFCRQQLKKNIA
ncbi:MAG: hypothetical protein WCF67_23190 [Chitinophagaceae bacterium]